VETTGPRPLIGSGEAMQEIKQKVELVAKSNATVLINGESGTGKEMVARAIHYAFAAKKSGRCWR